MPRIALPLIRGYLRGTLPSAAEWGVWMLWGLVHSVRRCFELVEKNASLGIKQSIITPAFR